MPKIGAKGCFLPLNRIFLRGVPFKSNKPYFIGVFE
jgi:hypothetical protein